MPDSQPEANLPVHETTYRKLRDMVLFGELVPGQKVTIQGVVADLDAGMTPVREAIRRLIAEGALELHGNRRISVPVLEPPQIEELSFARLALEPKLAAMALPNISRSQSAVLEAIDAELDQAISSGDIGGYLEGNYRFHFEIYGAAKAPILLSLTQSLWLRFGPSLRVIMTEGNVSPGVDFHKAAIAALNTGDVRAFEQALRADIEQGIARVRAAALGAES